jgi:hypothetical protein
VRQRFAKLGEDHLRVEEIGVADASLICFFNGIVGLDEDLQTDET